MTPAHARRYASVGRALFEAGDLEAARTAFLDVLDIYPDHLATIHAVSTVEINLGLLKDAETRLRSAPRPSCDPRMTALIDTLLGQVLLTNGQYAEGFQLLDNWRRLPEQAPSVAPRPPTSGWETMDLNGARVLIRSEEGLGDQIMYARFARNLAEEGAEVTWAAPPPIHRLLSDGGNIATVGLGDTSAHDVFVPSSALPLRYAARDGFPASSPYLRAAPAPSGARIGVMTRGNPAHWNDARRSLPDREALRLRSFPDALDLSPESTGARDLMDTARIISGLDLIVTVDTAIAHLAGALEKPTWILLPSIGCDWRWLRDREDSPWYASARLFRQGLGETWADVLDRVEGQIRSGQE